MKQTFTFTLFLLLVCAAMAQAPLGFNYQAALRNSNGSVMASKIVILRFSILKGSASGSVEYQETYSATTSALGLVTATIGQGSVVSGAFPSIDWSSNTYYIKTEVDPGSGFVDMGTQQLISVPYALHAATANGLSSNAHIEPLQINPGSAASGQILKWNGTAWAPANETTLSAGTGVSITSNVINTPWTQNGNTIYNNNSGNIGINKNAPLANLHVEGSVGKKMAGLFTSGSVSSADSGTLAVFNSYTGNGFNSAITASVVGTSSYAAYLKSKWRGIQVDVTGNTTGIGMGGIYTVDNTGNINYGVYSIGKNATTENYGVYGYATGTGSTNYGVLGFGDGNNQIYGVRGWAQGTGVNYGVVGRGLNGTSNYGLYCVGNGVYTGTWASSSDQKLKSNIQLLTNSLDLVMKLSPSSYTFRTDDPQYKSMDLAKGLHYGFIAQELEQVIPAVVSSNVHYDPETGQTIEFKGVNYIEMIPVLTKAIQEQNALMQQQAALIKALEARVKQLEGQQSAVPVKTN